MKRKTSLDPLLATIKRVKQLGKGPMDTPNPFLFCVYHKDMYPAGDKNLGVPGKRGNGMDFDPSAPFRMYHGEKIPGFPQHPHRGFETITATIEGIIDHTDSLGNAGRYGHGDLQWMTAGAGIVHGENFPLINEDRPNPLRFFQIWLNLPKVSKMVQPDFVMHWARDVKRWEDKENNAKCTIWAGSYQDIKACKPTKDSYANGKQNEVGIYFVCLKSEGYFELPKCDGGAEINRTVYIIEGGEAKVNGKQIQKHSSMFPTMIETDGNGVLSLEALTGDVEFLILQGRPIKEPVVQHGPFVMSTSAEIMQAFEDYQKTQVS